MVVLVTGKNEEDPIKIEGARVATRLYVDFSDVQGNGRNSNPFKHLCMYSLPAKMKKIQSKLKALYWPQHISHCKSMGIFPDTQGQLTPQCVVRSSQNSNSVET